jgi:hypothetical protein
VDMRSGNVVLAWRIMSYLLTSVLAVTGGRR